MHSLNPISRWIVTCFVGITCLAQLGPAQSPKIHPWLAQAPGEFVRLIDRGNVQIKVDDEQIRLSGKSALTLFQFVADFDSKFKYEWMDSQPQNGLWKARIIAWMDAPTIRLEHTICIPSTYNPSEPWTSKLIKHEFDHVAISTDPRLVKIIQRVVQRRRIWVEQFEQTTMPSENDVRDRIRQEIAVEIKNCERMVQAQYDRLDKESSEGLSTIGNRFDFFLELYSVPGLERCQFAYVDEVRTWLKDKRLASSTKKDVEQHYLFLSP